MAVVSMPPQEQTCGGVASPERHVRHGDRSDDASRRLGVYRAGALRDVRV